MISHHSPDGRICVHTHTPGEREQAAIERGRQMYLAGEPEPDGESYISGCELYGYRCEQAEDER